MDTEITCWVCLTEANELKSLNEKFGKLTVLEAIHFVVNFDIAVDDDLPDKICYNCEVLLALSVIFKRRCLESQKIIVEYLSTTPLGKSNSLPVSVEDEVEKQIELGNSLVRISNDNERTFSVDLPIRLFARGSKFLENNFIYDVEKTTEPVNQKRTACGIQDNKKDDLADDLTTKVVTQKSTNCDLQNVEKEHQKCMIADPSLRVVDHENDATVNIESKCSGNHFDDTECLNNNFDFDVEKATELAIQKPTKFEFQKNRKSAISVREYVTSLENEECEKYVTVCSDPCFRKVNHENDVRVNSKSEHSDNDCDNNECLHSNFDCDVERITELANQKLTKCDIRNTEKEYLAAYRKVTVSETRESQKYVMANSLLGVILDHDYGAVVNIISKFSGNDLEDTERVGHIEKVQEIIPGEVDKTRHRRVYEGNKFTAKNWCPDCPEKFSTRDAFLKHRTIHTGQEPHLCAICGKWISFTTVRQHMKRHKNNLAHKCDRCDQRFVSRAELKSHYRVHTRERPFLCKVCGRGFSTGSARKIHEATHSDERPFKCDLCPRTFKIRVTLHYHRQSHTGERAYQCPVCNAAFRQSYHRLCHLRRHAKDTPNIQLQRSILGAMRLQVDAASREKASIQWKRMQQCLMQKLLITLPSQFTLYLRLCGKSLEYKNLNYNYSICSCH